MTKVLPCVHDVGTRWQAGPRLGPAASGEGNRWAAIAAAAVAGASVAGACGRWPKPAESTVGGRRKRRELRQMVGGQGRGVR